jgi:hypothetical protein
MCCGKKRTTIRMATPATRGISGPTMTGASTPAPRTAVRFTENSSVKVKGPASGREYEFSPSRPTQNVDPRDARLLLRSRFFRQG